jgi:hypothetical protein
VKDVLEAATKYQMEGVFSLAASARFGSKETLGNIARDRQCKADLPVTRLPTKYIAALIVGQ